MTDFQIPNILTEETDGGTGTFVIEPLDRGFGHTYGNSLRRVLLSMLSGAAVTSVRIEGVAHEFSTIKGVKEDVTDIILNFKDIICKLHTDADEVEVSLVKSGPGEVTAADIDLPSGVEIINAKKSHIATLESRTKLEMYITIGRGRGYVPVDLTQQGDRPIGVIPIDAMFSPVRRVTYKVEAARVGQRTDYDRLTLEAETDGSVEPQSALREAAEILIQNLAIFTDAERVEQLREEQVQAIAAATGTEAAGVVAPGVDGVDEILIEELELGVRSYNCLKRAGIKSVGELILKSEGELSAIPNFGKKSIDEVKDTLAARGLSLKQG